MRAEVMDVLRAWYPKYLRDGRVVLDLGSREVYGGAARSVFVGNHEYTGIDMMAGPGVDMVMNFHDLDKRYEEASVDTVVCIDTLEHDDRFWLTLEQAFRALRNGGHLVLSVPTIGYPTYHGYPKDYYRFTRPAFTEVLLNPIWYEHVDIREISTRDEVDTLVGIGRRR